MTIELYNMQISNYRFKVIWGGTKAGERENGEGLVVYMSSAGLKKKKSASFRHVAVSQKQQNFVLLVCHISVLYRKRKRCIMIPSCFWLQISVAPCFRQVSVNGFRFLTYIYTSFLVSVTFLSTFSSFSAFQKQNRSCVHHHFKNKMPKKTKPL